MIRIFTSKNSYSAQIESIGINFRFGFRQITIVPKGFSFNRLTKPWYQWFFPRISIRLFYDVGQKNKFCIVRLDLFSIVKMKIQTNK